MNLQRGFTASKLMAAIALFAIALVAPVNAMESVIEGGTYLNLTASGQVMAKPGRLIGILVAQASASPTIKVWDNTAASGAVLVNTFTPLAGTFYPIPTATQTGLFVTIGGTVDLTVFYSPN